LTIAAMNFGLKPEDTLEMSYTLLLHMLEEFSSLNEPKDEKETNELSLDQLHGMNGIG